jgi:hypothetical protein
LIQEWQASMTQRRARQLGSRTFAASSSPWDWGRSSRHSAVPLSSPRRRPARTSQFRPSRRTPTAPCARSHETRRPAPTTENAGARCWSYTRQSRPARSTAPVRSTSKIASITWRLGSPRRRVPADAPAAAASAARSAAATNRAYASHHRSGRVPSPASPTRNRWSPPNFDAHYIAPSARADRRGDRAGPERLPGANGAVRAARSSSTGSG